MPANALPLPLLARSRAVIVGGGNAGLVLANRLSEDESNTVAVIEAGESGEDETSLTTPNAMVRYHNLSASPPFFSMGVPSPWSATKTILIC